MRKFALIAGAALLLAAPLAMTVEPALAQAVVVADEPTSPWQAIWKEVGAAVWPALGLLVMGLLTWVTMWVREKFKWDVSDTMKNTVHSAIMSGILFGLKRVGWDPTKTLTDKEKTEVAASAVAYAKASSPSAIAGTGATDVTLSKLAEGKVEGVVTGILAPAVPAGASVPSVSAPPRT